MKIRNVMIPAAACMALCAIAAPVKRNVVDEVAWIVGDEPIFRSEIEDQYAQMRSEGTSVAGDPYCVIPERIAVEKLYLHQAKIDTVEAPEGQVQGSVDKRLAFFINNFGSREKVEDARCRLRAIPFVCMEVQLKQIYPTDLQATTS